MRYLDLHRKYVKNALSEAERRIYFDKLKIDPHFRDESKRLKEMYDFFDKGLNRLDVPDKVTDRLFKSVGIKPKKKHFKYKYLALLLIIPIIFIFSKDVFVEKSTNISKKNKAKSNQVAPESEADLTMQIQAETKNDESDKNNGSHFNSNEFVLSEKSQSESVRNSTKSNFEKYEDNSKNANVFLAENKNNENQNIKLIDVSDLHTYQTDLNITKNQVEFTLLNNKIKILEEHQSNFSIELSNAPGWYFSNTLIRSRSTSQIENFEYSLLYKLNDRLKIGVLYKNELLFTDYAITNDINTFYYYKYVELNSYGLVAEYTTFTIIPKLTSFIRLGVSFSKNAMISKEMFGMKYALYEDVYFKLGLETNQYYYKALEEIKIKGKYNLIFGVGLSF